MKSLLDVLRYIKPFGLVDACTSLYVVLRILMTIPVSVASGERSFSRLKLIKTYLRSTMSQDRLNGLAMSIEHVVGDSIDYDEVIDIFAKNKVRKQPFL